MIIKTADSSLIEFKKILETFSTSTEKQLNTFKAACVDTPLGAMIAIGDETQLHLLEFLDGRGLEQEIRLLMRHAQATILPSMSPPIAAIEKELKDYFGGTLKEFKTPFCLHGTPFQKQVWHALLAIPYGQTKSYSEQAKAIDSPLAYRAVANANGANQLAIIVPCHRVIRSHGELGGYGGGISRKKWLIEHEAIYE